MSVWYLDLDDEITDAVARLRAAKDDKVVLVLPPGSRIGTGRINFRLLAREAETRGLTVAIVSSDAQVRALASTAGLDVAWHGGGRRACAGPGGGGRRAGRRAIDHGGVGDAARRARRDGGRRRGDRGRGRVAARLGSLRHRGRHREGYAVTPRTATAAAAADGAATVAPHGVGEGARIVRRGPSTKRRVATWGMRGAIIGALAAGGLYVAYLTLPTATRDPHARHHDAARGSGGDRGEPQRRPAWTRRPAPSPPIGTRSRSSETHTFEATGRDDVTTFAQGTVRFTSKNTLTPVVIREGTVVRTNDGKEYRTTQECQPAAVEEHRWPEAVHGGGRSRPCDEGRTATPGRDTVSQVPAGYERQQVRVTNPDPIAGGDRTLVRKRRAASRLRRAPSEVLDAALEEKLALELRSSPPRPGLTRYPTSATLGEPEYSASLRGARRPAWPRTSS